MNIIVISSAADVRRAADIAVSSYRRLTAELPWLPPRGAGEFIPRIEWMMNEGRVYALEDGGSMEAFLGWFRLDDFRNLGPGALTPDWCWGVRDDSPDGAPPDARAVSRRLSPLVRHMLGDLARAGLPVHAVGVPASAGAGLEEFSLLGWGRIVLDAARPARDLRALLDGRTAGERTGGDHAADDGITVRPANPSDARSLAMLDARLAAHISEPPVLMPDARGSDAGEWAEWLERPDALTFVAERAGGGLAGFIKAAPPGFDVSWFVHGEETLAICGLWVEPSARGSSVGERLLSALVDRALSLGKTLVSVDCETHNPEARAFWLRYFAPVSWSFERRF